MTKARTLSTKINELRDKGYVLNFQIQNGKLVCPEDEGIVEHPTDINIDSRHRFEGMSNPSDLSIIYAIALRNGKKGLLVDGYGAYNSEEVAEFIRTHESEK